MDPAHSLLLERRTGRTDGLMAPDHGVVTARGGSLSLTAPDTKERDLENPLYVAMILSVLILLASMISVELGVTVAIVEIALGVVAGNVLGIDAPGWLGFLAAFASVVLTFLAGAEVNPSLLRSKFKESFLIGGVSFLAPFLFAWGFCQLALGWDLRAALIGGIALSTTSLAVVYAVLVETGLNKAEIGKLIMAATFVTDLGTVLALTLLFVRPTPWLLAFVGVSAAAIFLMPRLESWFFGRYGNRVIEPEIKGAFAVLLVLMFFAELAQSHAVLPAFLLGLAVARVFHKYPPQLQSFRVVAFAFLTPFFFLKGGMNISVPAVVANIGLVALLLGVKLVPKIAGVYPLARRYVPRDAWFTTLLMSTGLTFGTISSLYGLNAGIIDRTQFSVLVTVVVLTAILPTLVAQRWFTPHEAADRQDR
jgi:Kef-type K+ transport system membrane component KefB